jgi:RecQ family ATP-dependent DNA helicase
VQPWLESFLLDHPVFHISTLEDLLAKKKPGQKGKGEADEGPDGDSQEHKWGGRGDRVPTLRGLINHLRKNHQIEGIRQKVFRSLIASSGAQPLDPFLVVSQLEPYAVLSHRAALHWHLERIAPKTVHFLSRQIAHPWPSEEGGFEGRSYVPVQDLQPGVAIEKFRRGAYRIQVTSPERTLVDLLNRPDLEGARLPTWHDLQCLTLTDESLLMDYLERLENRTLNAKVAYFLDMLPWDHFMHRRCLGHFGGRRLPLPKKIVPWDNQQVAPTWEWDEKAATRSEWSIRIPGALATLETRTTGDSEGTGGRSQFDSGAESQAFLHADLSQNFGFSSYREGQEDLVGKVLRGEDAFGILPTGSGKSLTYLQPSTLLNGPTIVISPLVALIDDQINEAKGFKLNAFALNQANRKEELPKVREHLHEGKVHLIFIPPESWPWLFKTLPRLRTLTRQIVVDEAHLVVEWGQDFRKAYRHLGRIREKCSAPILALTATATLRTQGEIIRNLKLQGIKPSRHSVRKPNLSLHIERICLPDGREIPPYLQKVSKLVRRDLREALYQARLKVLKPFLAARPGMRGIIFCDRKLDADLLAEELQGSGMGRIAAYHGNLESAERKERLVAFKEGNIQIMVATVAFGLGVNIDDLGFVVHFGMPSSLDAYTQAIGRAGRDSNSAECLVIHVQGEEAFLTWLAGLSSGARRLPPRQSRRRREQIQAVVDWLHGSQCRHASLDEYFGIKGGPACGTRCDACLGMSEPLVQPKSGVLEVSNSTESDPWGGQWDFSYDVELDPSKSVDD